MKRQLVTVAAILCGSTGCLSHGTAEPRSDDGARTHQGPDSEPASSEVPTRQPEELGGVRWLRNLEEGKAAARRTGKPVFLLFTEVPGCSTVRGFANGPLQHPLIIEAIEDEFVPVVIYNNRAGGHDREVLNAYGEPAWNNPVVRFVDANGKDVAARYGSDWTEATLVPRMVEALRAVPREVPGYLRILAAEQSSTL